MKVPILLILALAGAVGAAASEIPAFHPDAAKRIAENISEQPRGLGPTIADRDAWDRIAQEKAGQAKLWNANKLLAEELPKYTDELYLDFSKTGNRANWEAVHRKHLSMLNALVLGECLENKGRFLARIEELFAEFFKERTWVWPAHDTKLQNFNGTATDIDLTTATFGWELATADHLLGDKLKPETRKALRENLQRRILSPFRDMFSGERKPMMWMHEPSNWTAVSTAGITGAALAVIEDRDLRAEYVAAAVKYAEVYLKSFSADGCTTEGFGYWVYGFWHYVALSETVRQACGMNFMNIREAQLAARFGMRIEVINGVAPAYGDCDVSNGPPNGLSLIMYYINRFYGLELKKYEAPNMEDALCGTLVGAVLCWFPSTTLTPIDKSVAWLPERVVRNESPLRSWFDETGILIGRPAPDSECRMGVAIKGGCNDGPHTHRDVGSFVVVVGKTPVILDPGREYYSARSFSDKRFECKLTNSFGHSVPVIAGQLQRGGKDACAKIVSTEFTDTADTIVMDIASAYAVKELRSLRRTFVYSREGNGSLTVTDNAEFEQATAYQTALITRGTCQKQEDGSLLLKDDDSALRVEVDAGGAEWKLENEEIRENAAVKPTHVGIQLVAPAANIKITLKITPVVVAP